MNYAKGNKITEQNIYLWFATSVDMTLFFHFPRYSEHWTQLVHFPCCYYSVLQIRLETPVITKHSNWFNINKNVFITWHSIDVSFSVWKISIDSLDFPLELMCSSNYYCRIHDIVHWGLVKSMALWYCQLYASSIWTFLSVFFSCRNFFILTLLRYSKIWLNMEKNRKSTD